jgi:hypothetical protein
MKPLRAVSAAFVAAIVCAPWLVYGDRVGPVVGGTQIHVAPAGTPAERLIGLLELPDVIGPPCGLRDGTRQAVYTTPDRSRSPLGSLRFRVLPRPGDGACDEATLLLEAPDGTTSTMPTAEIGYEEQALIVFEHRGGWYRVKTPNGSAWIERASPPDFTAYEDLLIDNLTYLDAGWDGVLWVNPDAASFSVGDAWHRAGEAFPVKVMEHRRVAGVLWLRVRLQREVCGIVITDAPEPTGWVPAYRLDGQPVAWFYSRGC